MLPNTDIIYQGGTAPTLAVSRVKKNKQTHTEERWSRLIFFFYNVVRMDEDGV